MRIAIACPAPPGSRSGNRVTAERWRGLLRELGHSVRVVHDEDARAADLLVAVHATQSADAVARFRARSPGAPVVVCLAGTDLYQHLAQGDWDSLAEALRLVVLHPLALADIPVALRKKTRVIVQSAVPPRQRPRRNRRFFDVTVVAHLREVKDPFRTEEAVRGLPVTSRLRVRHVGRGLERGLERDARQRAGKNPRYVWLGERAGWETRREIARSRLLVLTSRFEGGANVVSEAVVSGVPVLSSRIACVEGLLGRDYPGFFSVGDTAALRALLERAESEPSYLEELRSRCRARRPLFTPARERRAWKELLAELRSPAPARLST